MLPIRLVWIALSLWMGSAHARSSYWWMQNPNVFSGGAATASHQSSGLQTSGGLHDVETECPVGTQCVQSNFCDANGVVSSIPDSSVKRDSGSKLIPCVSPGQQGFGVCCSTALGSKDLSGAESVPDRSGALVQSSGSSSGCPVISALPPVEACSQKSSNCWSVGQADLDCQNNALCCFDGCVNSCYFGAAPQPFFTPAPSSVIPVGSASSSSNGNSLPFPVPAPVESVLPLPSSQGSLASAAPISPLPSSHGYGAPAAPISSSSQGNPAGAIIGHQGSFSLDSSSSPVQFQSSGNVISPPTQQEFPSSGDGLSSSSAHLFPAASGAFQFSGSSQMSSSASGSSTQASSSASSSSSQISSSTFGSSTQTSSSASSSSSQISSSASGSSSQISSSTSGSSFLPADSKPFVSCPSAMLCVKRVNCDFNGVITQKTLNLSPDLEMLRVPLIPCVNPDTTQVDVCCRDPNYKNTWQPGQEDGSWTGPSALESTGQAAGGSGLNSVPGGIVPRAQIKHQGGYGK